MAYAFVNQGETSTGAATSTTIAVTYTPTAGNLLVFGVTWGTATGTASMADAGVGNTFTQFAAPLADGTANQSTHYFYALNCKGGSTTFTATVPSSQFRCIYVGEYSGTTGAPLNTAQQQQRLPTNGTDIVTSGNANATAQPALVWGFTNDYNAAAATAAGTGYTGRTLVWNYGGATSASRPEDKRVTVTGNVAATFTAGANGTEEFHTIVGIFAESVPGGVGGGRLFSNPGAGPFMASMFPAFVQGIAPTQATAQIGQPWFFWQQQKRIEAEEDIYRQPNTPLLHRYRQAFQTVGQSYRLWPIAKVRLEPEDYALTRPADLSPFRQITPATTGGQPWYFWQRAKIDWDIEVATPKANHDLLHRYRFAFQTVGQSWLYRIKPQTRLDEEPTAPAKIADLTPFRGTAPTVQAGQPWFIFAPAKPDLTIEPDAVRTDHAATMEPFRPHQATEPIIVIVSPEPSGSVPGWVPDSEGRLHGPYKRPGQVFGETFPFSPDLGITPTIPATLDIQYVSPLERMSEGIAALVENQESREVRLRDQAIAVFALWAMMESDDR